MQNMLWQKHYAQITVSTESLALALETDEDSSAEFTRAEEEEMLQTKAMLDAKIENTIKAIEQTNEKRRNSIEGSAGLVTGSNHSSSDCSSLQMVATERSTYTSGLSMSEHCLQGNKQSPKSSGLSVSDHGGKTHPVSINRKSDLDLNLNVLHQSNPLKAADVRRRRKSANDEPSTEEKRRARKLIAQNGRRRASIACGQKSSNCRELVTESVETRPRLRKVESRRTLSTDSDYMGLQKDSTGFESLIQRSSSMKRISDGNESSGNSGGSRERLQRGSSWKALFSDSSAVGLQKQSTNRGAKVRRSGSRRKLSIESCEPSLQASLGRRKVASRLSTSEHGHTHRNSGSKAQSTASRRRELIRSSSMRLVGNLDDTLDHTSSDLNNFTWTWKKEETEPTLRWSNQPSLVLNISPKPMSCRALGVDSTVSSTPPIAKIATRRQSLPQSCGGFVRSDHPMASLKSAQRQQLREKKIFPKRSSKPGDSLLSPGARRNSRASKKDMEQLVSPLPRQSSYPNLPLATPDSKPKSSFTKTRGTSLRRQASKVIVLEASNAFDSPMLAADDVVNKKDIGAIAKVLKESNQAEEELLRQKEEERQAKRSHVRARRRKTSLELTW